MSDKTLPITGGCLCGAVRFESSEPPGSDGTICHCRICQKAYGNGFAVTADFASKTFRFTRGEPRMYASSNVGERGFCAVCGSPLIMRYTSLPEKLWVNVGVLDDPDVAKDSPAMHVGIESELPWLTIHDDLPRNRCDDVAIYDEVGLVLDDAAG